MPKKKESPKKWVDLAKTVSFFDLIRSLDSESEEAKSLRAQYGEFIGSMSFDGEMRRLLEEENAVIPKRLETYVQNQAESKNRALVELVSNAVDASIERREKIGRFGVGFYQVLGWLDNQGDQVSVGTRKQGSEPIRADFQRKKGEYQLHLERPGDFTSPHGTVVEVNKDEFSSENQAQLEGYLRKYMELSSEAIIAVNGRPINRTGKFRYLNGAKLDMMDKPVVEVEIDEGGFRVIDRGVGMNERTTLESLLVPKKSEKLHEEVIDQSTAQAETRIFYSADSEDKRRLVRSKARIQVNGVLIEDFEFEGVNMPKELVVELPAESWLPESRNRIEINRPVIEGMKSLIDKVTRQSDVSDRYQLVNGLAAITRELQSRNTTGDNLLKHFYERVEENVLGGQPISPVPNTPDFLRVGVSPKDGFEVVYLDDGVFKFKPSNVGLEKSDAFDSTKYQVVLAELDSKDRTEDLYFEHGNTIVLDKDIYNKFKDEPAFLNALLNFHIQYGERPSSKGRFRRPRLEEIAFEAEDSLDEERERLEGKLQGVKGKDVTYLKGRINAAIEAQKTLAKLEETERLYDSLVKEGLKPHEVATKICKFINAEYSGRMHYSFREFGESFSDQCETGHPKTWEINKYVFGRIKERLNSIIDLAEGTNPRTLSNLRNAEELLGISSMAEKLSIEKHDLNGTPETKGWHSISINGEEFYLNTEHCLLDATTVIYQRVGDQLVKRDLPGLEKPFSGVEFAEEKEGVLIGTWTESETEEYVRDKHPFLLKDGEITPVDNPFMTRRRVFESTGRELYTVDVEGKESGARDKRLMEFNGEELLPVEIQGSEDGILRDSYCRGLGHMNLSSNGYSVLDVAGDKTLLYKDGQFSLVDLMMRRTPTQELSQEFGMLLNERDRHFYTLSSDGTPQKTPKTAPEVDKICKVGGRKLLFRKIREDQKPDGSSVYGSQVYKISELRDGEFIDESPFEEEAMKGDYIGSRHIGDRTLLITKDENGQRRHYITENGKED
jgi:hypothetical protein